MASLPTAATLLTQPNKNPDTGQPAVFGTREPEDLFGPGGWCRAKQPTMPDPCPCIVDGYCGLYCDKPCEPFCPNQCSGGMGRRAAYRAGLLLPAIMRLLASPHAPGCFYSRVAVPALACWLRPVAPIRRYLPGPCACRAWRVHERLLQVPRGVLGARLRIPLPRHRVDAR